MYESLFQWAGMGFVWGLILAFLVVPLLTLIVIIRKLNKKSYDPLSKVIKGVIFVSCLFLYPIGLLAFVIVYFMDKRSR